MRIAIANTQAPFVSGGAEEHARRLCEECRAAGHQAELVTIPFNWRSAQGILDHAVAAASIDLEAFFGQPIDLMIGLRFPAYLMQHPNKVVWLIHQYREAYDLWDAGRSSLLGDKGGQLVRGIIHDMDRLALSAARKVYTNSANVSARLEKYSGLKRDPLYHPPPLADRLGGEGYEDYFYFPSRISDLKRQRLVLDALSRTSTPARVIFSGGPDSEADGIAFRRAITELGLASRVEWRGYIGQDEMLSLYAKARGVIFPPFDEDLGYVTLEAMLASRPVITTTDSGGPLEFVRDGVEGLVVAPEPGALADAIDRLWNEPSFARKLGKAALGRYKNLSPSWQDVLEKLTRSA